MSKINQRSDNRESTGNPEKPIYIINEIHPPPKEKSHLGLVISILGLIIAIPAIPFVSNIIESKLPSNNTDLPVINSASPDSVQLDEVEITNAEIDVPDNFSIYDGYEPFTKSDIEFPLGLGILETADIIGIPYSDLTFDDPGAFVYDGIDVENSDAGMYVSGYFAYYDEIEGVINNWPRGITVGMHITEAINEFAVPDSSLASFFSSYPIDTTVERYSDALSEILYTTVDGQKYMIHNYVHIGESDLSVSFSTTIPDDGIYTVWYRTIDHNNLRISNVNIMYDPWIVFGDPWLFD